MRESYSREFKLKAASMVLDDEPSVLEVCSSLDIVPTALSRSIHRVRQERQGSTSAGAKTITSDKRDIQELKALLK